MKTFYVKYTYEGYDGEPVSGEHYSESEEEAKKFIEQTKNRRQVISLTLITYEEII